MSRRILLLLLISFSVPLACSRPDKTGGKAASDASQPVPGDWVIVRYESEPATLNPLINQTTTGQYAMIGINNSQIYELLMRYNTTDWGLTEPLLAEAPPAISDDRRMYTFTIRQGVQWHDGRPLTSEDVLFTFKAMMCPLVDSALYRSYLNDLTDVRTEGRNVSFEMDKPSVFNVDRIANTVPIISKHVFDSEGLLDGFSFKDVIAAKVKTDPKIKRFAEQFNTHPSNRSPVGTGPYKFEKWETGRELVLARNDSYWGKKAYLDKIVIRVITDATTALAALKAGEVDLQPRLLPVQHAQLTSGPAFDEQLTKTKYSIPAEFQIMWNNERPFFKDKRVRQAMTMLVDRQQIIDTVRFGLGRIGVSPIIPKSRNFNSNLRPWPYDPKRAAELLDEAGWKDHDGDSIRDKEGVKFRFEFLGAAGGTLFSQLSPILKEQFRKVGIEMTERVVDANVLLKTLQDHRFDATLLGATFNLEQEQEQTWHSSSALNGGTNYVSFKNAESDRLLEQIRVEFNDEKRKQLYWRWQEVIHDEQPYTFLYYQEEPAAYSKRFQNVQWLPLRPGYDLNSWWVPKPLQKYGAATRAQ